MSSSVPLERTAKNRPSYGSLASCASNCSSRSGGRGEDRNASSTLLQPASISSGSSTNTLCKLLLCRWTDGQTDEQNIACDKHPQQARSLERHRPPHAAPTQHSSAQSDAVLTRVYLHI